jgi:serine/threonine protein kinase
VSLSIADELEEFENDGVPGQQKEASQPGPASMVDGNANEEARRLLTEALFDDAVGLTIGRYKLREKIGEGGGGVVYVAEQTEPVRRKIALKLIKLGMDTKQVIARFEAERQALAMMDHPNIAKVLDAGRDGFWSPLLCHGVGSGNQAHRFL